MPSVNFSSLGRLSVSKIKVGAWRWWFIFLYLIEILCFIRWLATIWKCVSDNHSLNYAGWLKVSDFSDMAVFCFAKAFLRFQGDMRAKCKDKISRRWQRDLKWSVVKLWMRTTGQDWHPINKHGWKTWLITRNKQNGRKENGWGNRKSKGRKVEKRRRKEKSNNEWKKKQWE